MPAGAEDDFGQFLDMGGISSLGDGFQFDFQDFSAPGGGPMMQLQLREPVDTSMGGTEPPGMTPRNGLTINAQMPPLTSPTSQPGASSQMVSSQRSASDAISDIDVQIRFLRQHRQLEEQRKRLEEQQAAFFARQQQGMIPPTPRSLEILPRNQFYGQPEHAPQHHSSGMFDRYQRLQDQQDV